MKTNCANATRAKMWRWWVLTIICVAGALFLSNQIGANSAVLSNKAAKIAYNPLARIFPNLTDEDYVEFHYFFRKLFHAIVHATVSFSLLRACWYTIGRKTSAVFLALSVACAIAVFDEVVQISAPGRVWEIRDAGINLIGAVVGICLSGITI